ncbi:MAG: hypothetical protein HYW49_08030 [Deltaproteobacteria bacterium]|nr:hypothetical protein [Deltaproteobacteria bacterium]
MKNRLMLLIFALLFSNTLLGEESKVASQRKPSSMPTANSPLVVCGAHNTVEAATRKLNANLADTWATAIAASFGDDVTSIAIKKPFEVSAPVISEEKARGLVFVCVTVSPVQK